MSNSAPPTLRDRFNDFTGRVTAAVGSPFALVGAALLILIWAITGPIFGFSETRQLVINTGTTIITFLMVFVIQASQNRDSKALHLKLDEVIRSIASARNEYIEAEQSTDEQTRDREAEFRAIAEGGRTASSPTEPTPPSPSSVRRGPR